MSDTVLTVLGSGCFTPGRERPVRNPAGYALARRDEVLLFDLGFGNLRQLARAGLDPRRVTDVFLSHRHPDHVGDLAALLFFFRYDAPPLSGRLRLFGPRGLRAFLRRLSAAHAPWLGARGYRLEARELGDGSRVRGPGWTVDCRRVPHSTEALAFRFESAGGSFAYSGDTGYDAGLAAFVRGVDALVLECTLPDREPSRTHLRVGEALRLADAAGARRTLFSHLSPASARELGRRVRGRRGLSLARDLQRIALRSGA